VLHDYYDPQYPDAHHYKSESEASVG